VAGKKEKTNQKIMNATLELFSKYGIMKTTLSDIAKKVGMAKSSLYYYYPSKNSIIECTARWIIGEYIADVKDTLASESSPPDRIRKFIFFHFNWITGYYKDFHLVLDEVFSVLPLIIKEIGGDFLDGIHSLILEVVNDGIDQGFFEVNHPSEFVYMVLFSLRGLETNIYYRQGDGTEMINEFTTVLIKGITK
jgi:TetR/AcrR family transcriptional regulator